VLVVLGQGDEKLGLNGRLLHLNVSGSSVLLGDISRNGPSVPLWVTLVECTNAAGSLVLENVACELLTAMPTG
jgi:hypothetical protein